MKIGMYKHCPRCGEKVPATVAVCPNCSLSFQKFLLATNGQAKKDIKQGEKEKVLMRTGRPSDIKFVPMLLITIFLGMFGGHYYYTGRYKMGIFFSSFFAIGVANAVITNVLKIKSGGHVFELFYLLVLVWGFVLVLWIIDVAKVILNKFKYPVSRD